MTPGGPGNWHTLTCACYFLYRSNSGRDARDAGMDVHSWKAALRTAPPPFFPHLRIHLLPKPVQVCSAVPAAAMTPFTEIFHMKYECTQSLVSGFLLKWSWCSMDRVSGNHFNRRCEIRCGKDNHDDWKARWKRRKMQKLRFPCRCPWVFTRNWKPHEIHYGCGWCQSKGQNFLAVNLPQSKGTGRRLDMHCTCFRLKQQQQKWGAFASFF